MATTEKKKTTGKSTATGKRGAGGAKKSAAGGKTTRKDAPKPIRREVGGGVCLILAVIASLGYFNVHAIFIDWIGLLIKGLFGYGYWVFSLMLVVAGFVLLFHRGRPVRLRVWCCMLTTMLFGAIAHLFLAKETYEWKFSMVKELWKSGGELKSGGVISGALSQGLIAVVSKIGAGIIFFLLLLVFVIIITRVTPSDILGWLRRPRPEYEPEPEKVKEKKEPVSVEAPQRPAKAEKLPAAQKPRPNIDISVDDAPEQSAEAVVPTQGRKKSFFNRKAAVPAPDAILSQNGAQEPAGTPAAPAAAVVTAPAAPAQPVQPVESVQPEIRPAAESVHSQSTEAEFTLPEIVREPAVEKVKPEEAAKAAAEVALDIEKSLEEEHVAYQYPSLTLLKAGAASNAAQAMGELKTNQTRLEDTIKSFGIDAKITNVTRGPSITRYELELDQGVRLNKLTNLADDIALSLGASGVRIAPIPDQISMVGIEVPNRTVSTVPIRDVLGSAEFSRSTSKVSFAVGKDIGGRPIVGNISKLPHLLIAGTTGSGKSVCTNSLIISLLYKASPEEVRLIMVDPKMVELGIYNGIPHLLIPVVTDPKKAAGALQWAVTEMMKRYRSFSEVGVRDLASYNEHAKKTGDMTTMPQIVVVIDELADLMLVAAKEVEESICRIAQMGRAAGVHLIVATQRPSADVITGLMKANIPSRIAFAVASSLESRIILDTVGAEKLVGKGDMLYAPLGTKPTRVQGCLISDEEVAAVVEFIKGQGNGAAYDEEVIHEIERNAAEKEKGNKNAPASASAEESDGDFDELLPAAIEVVVETGMASVSMLQRRLKLGYSRAARLVDQMEEKGVVGPFEGSKPRQVLITKDQWQEMQFRQGMVDTAPAEPVPEEFGFEGDAIEQGRDFMPADE